MKIILTESTFNRLMKESKPRALPNNVLKNENGEPMVFYHSYEDEDHSDYADMIWLSTNKKFSQEFGNMTDMYYACPKKPYILPGDELQYDDGTVVMFEGEPAGIGYLDAVDYEYIDWLTSNYDAIMTKNGNFLVVFSKRVLIPIKQKKWAT